MREANQRAQQPPERRPMRLATYFLVWWAVLFGIWIVLVDTLAHPEYLAGPAAAGLAAIAALATRRRAGARFRLRLAWLRLLASVPGSVLRDCAVLLAVLVRRLVRRQRPHAAFRAVPFPRVANDSESVAWRAVATIVTSLSPNTIVVGIDTDRHAMLIHQLLPDDPARLRRVVVGAASPAQEGGHA